MPPVAATSENVPLPLFLSSTFGRYGAALDVEVGQAIVVVVACGDAGRRCVAGRTGDAVWVVVEVLDARGEPSRR